MKKVYLFMFLFLIFSQKINAAYLEQTYSNPVYGIYAYQYNGNKNDFNFVELDKMKQTLQRDRSKHFNVYIFTHKISEKAIKEAERQNNPRFELLKAFKNQYPFIYYLSSYWGVNIPKYGTNTGQDLLCVYTKEQSFKNPSIYSRSHITQWEWEDETGIKNSCL